ncbi:hypothetical protein BDV93DRAFT_519112 [Ceratobasidium sp. AG-I]|nr:hypothetical protein BDV93DRAFT_519112 [Ceratobasidium sp. AG-I]
MASHAARLVQLFTPTYVRLINAQLVAPAQAAVVEPNELKSALARPLQTAHYEPHRAPEYLAASMSFGIIKGHPFLDGNKRTAFFVGNEYLRNMGIAGVNGDFTTGEAAVKIKEVVDRHVMVARGELGVQGFSGQNE